MVTHHIDTNKYNIMARTQAPNIVSGTGSTRRIFEGNLFYLLPSLAGVLDADALMDRDARNEVLIRSTLPRNALSKEMPEETVYYNMLEKLGVNIEEEPVTDNYGVLAFNPAKVDPRRAVAIRQLLETPSPRMMLRKTNGNGEFQSLQSYFSPDEIMGCQLHNAFNLPGFWSYISNSDIEELVIVGADLRGQVFHAAAGAIDYAKDNPLEITVIPRCIATQAERVLPQPVYNTLETHFREILNVEVDPRHVFPSPGITIHLGGE